jgi:hypothetical protein
MKLVDDLAETVCHLHLPSGEKQRRIRLAVTPEEYQEIRSYMLDNFGEFLGRIMGIQLVVDPKATSDEVMVEWRD